VWEWNEAILDGSYRGLRGGAFNHVGIDGALRAAGRYYGNPTYELHYIGLRVAGVSGPSPVPVVSEWGLVAMALLVLTAGTLVWARCGAVVARQGKPARVYPCQSKQGRIEVCNNRWPDTSLL